MSPTLFIGIDPGASGGIATLKFGLAIVGKMPDTEADIMHLLYVNSRTSKCFAMIEAVNSMPGNGVASMFKFGRNYGFLRGCLISLGIPFDEVRPAVWQRKLGCLTKGDKNVSKAKAQQLFPGLKLTHATADALLIAEYARRTHWKLETAHPEPTP